MVWYAIARLAMAILTSGGELMMVKTTINQMIVSSTTAVYVVCLIVGWIQINRAYNYGEEKYRKMHRVVMLFPAAYMGVLLIIKWVYLYG